MTEQEWADTYQLVSLAVGRVPFFTAFTRDAQRSITAQIMHEMRAFIKES